MIDAAAIGAKVWLLLPEVWVVCGAVVVSVMGLARTKAIRDAVPLVVCAFLVTAMLLVPLVYADADAVRRAGLLMPGVGRYMKPVVCGVGTALALLSVRLVDRPLEEAIAAGRARFDPIRLGRGEFFAFFLLSLAGAMLVCNANDLIWLFLALELTSLPTYIMVAISRPSHRAQEAAVKYFFLGALAAGMFLYGFALLYGGAGTIVLTEMHAEFARQAAGGAGGLNRVAVVGMVLAVLGISYKIVAVPMHFYAADVYEGAAAPVTAFLAFVPKAAGTVAIVLLLSVIDAGGGALPGPLLVALWMVAVLTMTLGNVGALLQRSAKRLLAYSSIAHSGYILIGVIAGPGSGVNAALFYLLVYGVMNTAAFAALAALERQGEEVESLAELAGLRHRHAAMAAVLSIAAVSLIGFPPLLGFWGKLALFMAGMEAGQVALVVIAAVNSAISAFYYLLIVALCLLAMPTAQSETVVRRAVPWPRVAAIATAAAVLVLPAFVLTTDLLPQDSAPPASPTGAASGDAVGGRSGAPPDTTADTSAAAGRD
jgi:NADH-quinone oxidoreductase subunit N